MRIYGTIRDAKTEAPLSRALFTIYIGDTCLVRDSPSSDGHFLLEFDGVSKPKTGDILKCTVKKHGYKPNTFTYRIMEHDVELAVELIPIVSISIWPGLLLKLLILLGILVGLALLGLGIYYLFLKPSPPPKIMLIKNFSASPPFIPSGGPCQLKWEVYNAAVVYLEEQPVKPIATKEVTPGKTTSYILTAEDKKGKKITRTVTVTVPPVPTIMSFKATPSLIYPWGSTMLEWRAADAELVYISDGQDESPPLPALPGAVGSGKKGAIESPAAGSEVAPGAGKAELMGSAEVFPRQTTTYTLVAVNKAGVKVQGSVTVTVAPPDPPEIVDYTASTREILKGGTALLEWKTDKAEEVLFDEKPARPIYSTEVAPGETTTYTLVVKNQVGERRRNITICVVDPSPPDPGPGPAEPVPPPGISRFLMTPLVIAPGQTARLQWETQNAGTVYLNDTQVDPTGSTEVSPHRTTVYHLKVVNAIGQVLWNRILEVKPAPCTVTLYEFENWLGAKREFTADAPLIGNLHNQVSSIEITGNCKVKVYSAQGYLGTYQVFTRSVPRLRGTWIGNDAVSSLKIISLNDVEPSQEMTQKK